MTQEFEELIKAINGLKEHPNFVKDYFFPIAISIASSVMGFIVAYFTLLYQENTQLQKERINAINDWILSIIEAFNDLVSIKVMYYDKLSENPFHRVSAIRSFVTNGTRIENKISPLSFIAIKNKKDKWRDLGLIKAMVSNYNQLIEIWKKRNEIERPIREMLIETYGDLGSARINAEMIFKVVNPSKFIALISLNEQAIKLTDNLLIDMNGFINELPIIGRASIKNKYINKYGPILMPDLNYQKKISFILDKVPEVDYKIFSELLGISEDELRKMYSF